MQFETNTWYGNLIVGDRVYALLSGVGKVSPSRLGHDVMGWVATDYNHDVAILDPDSELKWIYPTPFWVCVRGPFIVEEFNSPKLIQTRIENSTD